MKRLSVFEKRLGLSDFEKLPFMINEIFLDNGDVKMVVEQKSLIVFEEEKKPLKVGFENIGSGIIVREIQIENKETKEFIPISENEDGSFQEDGRGNFRIIVKGQMSRWTRNHKIAVLVVGEEMYIGLSGKSIGHNESLPKNKVLKVCPVDLKDLI